VDFSEGIQLPHREEQAARKYFGIVELGEGIHSEAAKRG